MSSRERFEQLARAALAATAWVFVACLVVQLFLVGLDVFKVIAPESSVHRNFAYVYGWLTPGLVLLAAFGGAPRRILVQSVVLLVLFAIQTYLPSLKEQAPLLAAFHAVNALIVFWLAVRIAREAQARVEPLRTRGGS